MDDEVQTSQPPPGRPSSAYPRWVLLEELCRSNLRDSSGCTGDVMTVAAAISSAGHRIQASLRLAEPPATSAVCLQFPEGTRVRYSNVVAAHGDTLLIEVCFGARYGESRPEYFIYNAGAAAAAACPPRKPSLSLLPHLYLTDEVKQKRWDVPSGPVQRRLDTDVTGLLRCCGEDSDDKPVVVVAELQTPPPHKAPELFLLRSGPWTRLGRPPRISHGNGELGGLQQLPSSWTTYAVFALGDRRLCWVDLSRGVIFADVLDEIPVLRYVPLPADPFFRRDPKRTFGVSAAGATVRFVFVNVFPRCCCGDAVASYCRRSHNAYTIHTWTLRMDGDDDMSWVKDGMVDSTELWGPLDAFHKGLPRVPLAYPVVSMDEPHVVCFQLCEDYHVKKHGDETLWLVMVDTRSKTVRSVSRYPGGSWLKLGGRRNLTPSRISQYLNPSSSYPGTTGCDGDGTGGTSATPPAVAAGKQLRDDDARCSVPPSAEPATEASEILAALREIRSYDLDRDDMLKAYSIIDHDNGRRCRSLLRLPVNLRKDWLLMEIKASEAAGSG